MHVWWRNNLSCVYIYIYIKDVKTVTTTNGERRQPSGGSLVVVSKSERTDKSAKYSALYKHEYLCPHVQRMLQ